MYPFYEKAMKSGINNLCIHKGLMPRDYADRWAGVLEYQMLRNLVKVVTDWQQLSFIIYHGCLRAFFDKPKDSLGDFDNTGRIKFAKYNIIIATGQMREQCNAK